MNGPIIIAGPCSAESRQQVLETASAVKNAGVGIFRAGLWKPRTRPGSFEGVGEKGLDWLAEVRDTTGLEVCTEVACAAHVQSCLSAGIKTLWIGARTTANPFQVQEIADSVKGSDVRMLVKNPVNPDIELWAGAVERLRETLATDIILVHRGFTCVSALKYRNDPQWGLAVKMRSRFTELPMICDPSHLGGSREYIRELSQKALDLGMDGLMIEVHPHPDSALSDSRQQIPAESLSALLGELVFRQKDCREGGYRDVLDSLRSEIDILDEQLVGLLSERMALSKEIGRIKKENNIAIVQTSRWEKVLSNVRDSARRNSVESELVESIFDIIHMASINKQ